MIASHTVLVVPVPPGLALLPHQQEGISFALVRLRANRGVMFGDVMGLGKTIEAIATVSAPSASHCALANGKVPHRGATER